MRMRWLAVLALGLAACGDGSSASGTAGATGDANRAAASAVGTWVYEERSPDFRRIATLTLRDDGTYEGKDSSWNPSRDSKPSHPLLATGRWTRQGDEVRTTATSRNGKPVPASDAAATITLLLRDGALWPLANGQPVGVSFRRK